MKLAVGNLEPLEATVNERMNVHDVPLTTPFMSLQPPPSPARRLGHSGTHLAGASTQCCLDHGTNWHSSTVAGTGSNSGAAAQELGTTPVCLSLRKEDASDSAVTHYGVVTYTLAAGARWQIVGRPPWRRQPVCLTPVTQVRLPSSSSFHSDFCEPD